MSYYLWPLVNWLIKLTRGQQPVTDPGIDKWGGGVDFFSKLDKSTAGAAILL